MAYDKNRTILFIHIPKTAGKSIEHALGMVDHASGQRVWRRGKLNSAVRYLLKMTSNAKVTEKLFGPYDYVLGAQHLTYQEIELLNLIPPGSRKELITFSVIRNPYSRALSTYRHIFKKADLDGFKSFWEGVRNYSGVDHNELAHRRTQKAFLINCRAVVVVQNLLRMESLEADFESFCKEKDIAHSSLPLIGSHPEMSWEKFYDETARNMIAEIFDEDFIEFGYQK